MRTLKITVRYDGTSYFGFQKQKNVITLQEIFEKGLQKIYGTKIEILYAGRTDKGVHAKCQVISYIDNGKIPKDKLSCMLTKQLSEAFQIVSIDEVYENFDPRRHAEYREYEYLMYDGNQNIFLDRYMLYIPSFNFEVVNESIMYLVGRKDCVSLCYNAKQYRNTIIDIFKVSLIKDDYKIFNTEGNIYKFTIVASCFLQHMVRKIVGLIIEVNKKKITIDDFVKIVDNKMSFSWAMAPAKALFLSNIVYNKEERK